MDRFALLADTRKNAKLLHAPLTDQVIGAAIDVHRALGPGLLESAYLLCLCHELRLRSVSFARQLPRPVEHKGAHLDVGDRADLIVDDKIIVELKSVRRLERIHHAQLLAYLRLSTARVGLLLNFNVEVLRDGIVRRVL